MKRRLPRFGLLSLLAFPAMFALGWWMRGLNYKRDVYFAAEKIAEDSGGFFVPELGTIQGRKKFVDRYRAMTPEAKAEMERRMMYYTDVVEPDFDPPQRSILESLANLFSGDRHIVLPDSKVPDASSDAPDAGQIQRRIERFRQMRSSPSRAEQ